MFNRFRLSALALGLISSPIRNDSKHAGIRGTLLTTRVTIGDDAPWRQVHAMLIEAAGRTPHVRADPAPYVYQRAVRLLLRM